MFLDIHDLELHPVEFKEEFAPGTIDFGMDFEQRGPLRSAGRADLVEEHHGKHNVVRDIRLQGDVSMRLEFACARCLEPVVQDVETKFDLLYRPLGVDAGEAERSISGTEAEISYYEGAGLLLEDALREQVLLAAPLKVLCREACKGLCPQCGKNWNTETCDCTKPTGSQSWAALKDLREKLEH